MTMANLQKLNPTQQELYNYLEQQTGQVNFEVLQPFTTQEMGAVLHISRNTVSQYLNEFFKEGWMVKINTRPVYYFLRETLSRKFNVHTLDSEYEDLQFLQQDLNHGRRADSCFAGVIGYHLSLKSAVEKCRVAVEYPPTGLPLVLAGKGDMPTCRKLAESVIADGSAFEKCCQMFAAQGGDISVLRDADKFQKAKYSYELTAPADGYIYKNDVEKIGNASVLLGAGRIKKEDSIDFAAGITMHKKLGDYVKAGESICTFYADDESLFAAAEEMYRGGLVIRDEPPTLPPLVYARVTSDGVERF